MQATTADQHVKSQPLRLTLPLLARRWAKTDSRPSARCAPPAASSTGPSTAVDSTRCGSPVAVDDPSIFKLVDVDESPAWCYRDEDGVSTDQPAWVSYDGWAGGGRASSDGEQRHTDGPPPLISHDRRDGNDGRPPSFDVDPYAAQRRPQGAYHDGFALPPADVFSSSSFSSLSSPDERSVAPLAAAAPGPHAAWPSPDVEKPTSATPWRAVQPEAHVLHHAPTAPSTVDPSPLFDDQPSTVDGVSIFALGPSTYDSLSGDDLQAAAPGYFYGYERSLRSQVYGHSSSGPLGSSSSLTFADGTYRHPPSWATNDGRSAGAGSLRVLTDFHHQPRMETSALLEPYPAHSPPSGGPFSAPAGYALAPVHSAPLYDSMCAYPAPVSYASSETTSTAVSPLSLAPPPPSPPSRMPTPSIPPSFFINPFLSPIAAETQELTLPGRRQRSGTSDRMRPYPLKTPAAVSAAPSSAPPAAALVDKAPKRTIRQRSVKAGSLSAPATRVTFPVASSQSTALGARKPTAIDISTISTISLSGSLYPAKSHLVPPKRPKTSWQLYLADTFATYRDAGHDALNVATVTKEATAAYKTMEESKKQHYTRLSQEAKAAYEAEVRAWQRSLTPDDVRQENLFRTGQRKIGASSATNLKDPNAPAKPTSPFFLYLRAVRTDPALEARVFKGVSETARQSKLAGDYWKRMTSQEKAPYELQAAKERDAYKIAAAKYEAAARKKSAGKRT